MHLELVLIERAPQVLGAGVVDVARGDAQARADDEVLAVEVDHFGEAELYTLRDTEDVVGFDPVQQDRELVPAEASGNVDSAKLARDAGADRVQDAVAHLVAEGVVDGFEPVEVEEDNR